MISNMVYVKSFVFFMFCWLCIPV